MMEETSDFEFNISEATEIMDSSDDNEFYMEKINKDKSERNDNVVNFNDNYDWEK